MKGNQIFSRSMRKLQNQDLRTQPRKKRKKRKGFVREKEAPNIKRRLFFVGKKEGERRSKE